MNFNKKQLSVINANEPKILCLAAAAGGKTRVLTERIKRLLEEGIPPKDIVAITFTNLAADEMRKRLGSISDGMFIGTLHSYAARICTLSGIDIQEYIISEKFDDIIKKALTVRPHIFPKVKHLLIDECQDLNQLNYDFIDKIPTENIFYVGDNRQCQPAGTKVLLRNGIVKNIEDIEVGDSVVWYDNEYGYVSGSTVKFNSIEKKVKKIANRDFSNDNLITIITENGEKTQYTPNHIGFVRLHQSEYNHAVYLMCDDNYRFRIGKIPFTYTNKSDINPWRDKMYKEGCSKIWILKVFKTDKEARLLETKLSYKYRIPQTCWQLDKVSWTREDLDYIYEGLNTYESAKECLKEFHRDINYPLSDKTLEENSHIHFARNAVAPIFAANIMSEVMDVIVYDPKMKHYKRYEQIKEVQYEYIKESIKVYSLEVEGETYVADNIVTHNCIYQFRGASMKALLHIYNNPEFKKYYLLNNYRNTPQIIDFAENFLKNSKKLSPAPIPMKSDGEEVVNCSFYEALEDLECSENWGSWFILCRTNGQVQAAQELLRKKDIPFISFKKGDFTQEEIDELMASNRVKVLTVHSSKGLEIPNVIVTGGLTFSEEEKNICYVAATRAMNKLYWTKAIVSPGKRNVDKRIPVSAKTTRKIIEF